MGLISVPQITDLDRRAWEERERRDLVWGHRDRMAILARDSIRRIVEFTASGPCYASVSWGKDSVVLAHLIWVAREHGCDIRIGWVRVAKRANPWCHLVRDAFLSRWPLDYSEVVVELGQGESSSAATHGRGFRELERVMGTRRYLSGVRGDESGARALRVASEMAGNGMRSGAPLGNWTQDDVFAWLAVHDLPVNPTYAMTMDGRIPRESLRVSSVGGERGRGMGREEWENRYCAAAVCP